MAALFLAALFVTALFLTDLALDRVCNAASLRLPLKRHPAAIKPF